MTRKLLQLAFYLLLTASGAWAQGPESASGQVALTVYNGDYAIVREKRTLDVAADGSVMLTGVPTAIDPTTVSFKCLSSPSARLLEQNYQYDLVNTDSLLRRYIDRPITVVCEGAGYSGTLLSFDAAQIILRTDEGIAMIQRADNVRDIRFGALPDGLLTRPTLRWLLAGVAPGAQDVEVSYQTGSINWHAEYVLVLNDADTAGDLSGWVSVDNRSGRTYANARLKFIAGDVRRERPVVYKAPRAAGGVMAMEANAAPMVEKSFFEYHMYSLPRPSTVADKETKQLEMFTPARDIKLAKRFLYNPLGGLRWHGGYNNNRGYGADTGDKKVNVFIEFDNSKSDGLGMPLPAGVVRVFKRDDDDSLQFIGEQRIDHTPREEQLSLEIGNAFDLVGEWKQIDFNSDQRRRWMSEQIQVTLKNHKEDQDVVIRVKAPMHRAKNWRLTQNSAAEHYKKLDAFTSVWDIPVPADGEKVLTFTVEYTW